MAAGCPSLPREWSMISCYIDESGTHDDSVAIAVGGFASTPEVWMAFEKPWREILGRFGIDRFHMSDFVARVPPFDRFDEQERHDLISSLVDCISRHDLGGAAVVLKRADYPIARNASIPGRGSDSSLSDDADHGASSPLRVCPPRAHSVHLRPATEGREARRHSPEGHARHASLDRHGYGRPDRLWLFARIRSASSG